jgi:hypothetical protein
VGHSNFIARKLTFPQKKDIKYCFSSSMLPFSRA